MHRQKVLVRYRYRVELQVEHCVEVRQVLQLYWQLLQIDVPATLYNAVGHTQALFTKILVPTQEVQ
jgi:hypothetical protein